MSSCQRVFMGMVLLVFSLAACQQTEPTISTHRQTAQYVVFDQTWELVAENYLYEDFNGLDWAAQKDDYYALIDAGMTDEQFWESMRDLIVRLNDNHSVYLSPEEVAQEDAFISGNPDFVGVGVLVNASPDKQRELVLAVLPNSPAAQAGIQAHDWLLAANGEVICCDADGKVYEERILGPAGSEVLLTVQTPGEEPRDVWVTRAQIKQDFAVEGRRLSDDIGYILVPSLWNETIAEQTTQVWQMLAAEGDLTGLVLDLRINNGGFYTELIDILALFAKGEAGHFVGRDSSLPLVIEGQDVNGSQTVPLVVLVSDMTESFAEVLAGSLQAVDRATLIGVSTAGNVETLHGYNLEDGSRLWLAQETFIPLSGAAWEQVGVTPDIEVTQGWGDFSKDTDDIALQTAVMHLLGE